MKLTFAGELDTAITVIATIKQLEKKCGDEGAVTQLNKVRQSMLNMKQVLKQGRKGDFVNMVDKSRKKHKKLRNELKEMIDSKF